MNISRTTVLTALGLCLAFAGSARAEDAPEERLFAALKSVMTDAVVDGVAACDASDYSGWTARSQPGAMSFKCLPKSPTTAQLHFKIGDPKAFLDAGAVQKALSAQGLDYGADYSIYDVATKATMDQAAVDRAAWRAVHDRKQMPIINGLTAILKNPPF